ncbi:MAG TPA: hypothetical protein PKB10_02715 [Tepidisphaeraceae bacterium]|nr:hypothetical protein [Tepidisphaeraceae bacterium]
MIHRDDGTGAYTGAEWLDVNGDGDVDDPDDHHYPVGFRAGAAMRTIRDFRVKAPTTIVEQKDDLVVRGIADGGYEFFSRSSVDPNDPFNVFDIAVTLGNGNFITGDTASEAFPATVEHYDPMKIKWSVSTDGGTTWNSVADSHNQLYTFIGSPTGVVHHTTAHLASRGAAGREEPASIVDGIWTEFADNEVHRVDGTLLRYSHSEHGFGHTASEMLSREDGRGQCTAWAELLVAALDTHGILAVSVRVRAEHPDIGFSVRAMPAQGSLGQNYTDAGVWPKVFGYHQVVRVPMLFNRIYDPSYGSLTEPTDGRTVLLTYEDENVTHFWRVVNDVLLDRPNQPNDAQILEFFVP